MNDTFIEADKAYQAAKKRLDALVEVRAKELYPNYAEYDENDDHSEGGWMTKEACRKHALRTLREGLTAQEVLDKLEANRTVLRTVYMPAKLDDDLRVRAAREGRQKGDLIIEAVRVWFEALAFGETPPPSLAEKIEERIKAKAQAPKKRTKNK